MKITGFLRRNRAIFILLLLMISILIPELYLTPIYFVLIKPNGENSINEILSEINTLNDTEEKLLEIGRWESEDYLETFDIKSDFTLLGLIGIYKIYIRPDFEQPIKIRAQQSFFSNNPYWIAYFKAGACGERAFLFNFVANSSGELTRVVGSPGEDHSWVEVSEGDDWRYADPTLFYYYQDYSSLKNIWHNNTTQFQNMWGWNLSKVIINSDKIDITQNYAKIDNISIIIKNSNKISVSKYITNEQRTVTLFSTDINISPDFDIVTAQLGVNNNYTIIAEQSNFPFPSKWIEEKSVFLGKDVMVTLNPKNGREEIDYFTLSAWILISCIYALLFIYAFKIYKNRKKP